MAHACCACRACPHLFRSPRARARAARLTARPARRVLAGGGVGQQQVEHGPAGGGRRAQGVLDVQQSVLASTDLYVSTTSCKPLVPQSAEEVTHAVSFAPIIA
eukprot:CAMPEP_0179224298 /NCGR_PEP_ID=MMETSP0797-20121207/7707_1 /TAXON_ID=47934 /ORGANISM="Dinophysis acuminata, Strain DAEP01" /LENGTH=102 /DNA_ID=CAMNT_0020931253 /DNA_START=101 /DNA_END=410 /DNA_ORIENTATION=-